MLFHVVAFFLRRTPTKRLPRWLHIVFAVILFIFLLAMAVVFFSGGIVDPFDIWIMIWVSALFLLAVWRIFRKKQ